MKKWCRRILIAILLVGLVFGILYEYSTHVGRGWLCGEAFYEGRPTSYWALRCDEWLERFDDDSSLTVFTYTLPYQIPGDGRYRMWLPEGAMGGGGMRGAPGTTLMKFRNLLLSKDELERNKKYDGAPMVIWGAPESEAVLTELEVQDRFRHLVSVARTRIACYHKVEAFIAQEKTRERTP